METNENSSKHLTNLSWANVVATDPKPSEDIGVGRKKIIYKHANIYKSVSILEKISGMVPKEKIIVCMGGGTPFELGYGLGEFKVDIDLVIEKIIEQINDIKS
ncbi:hypothetical protein AYI70_g9108 [Smittium culicis]|uniref:Uncharacterized protein n=1 Tax=Smittium culicis TaxID=133412 RepID=A0A1R1XCY6_9FUNG|nr:hypothetical protein AYI70_g9108 [Smittium culicis]